MFVEKYVSRILVCATLAIALGTAGNALAYDTDSFFDVFTELVLDPGGLELEMQNPPVKYDGLVDTELVALSLKGSTQPPRPRRDLGGGQFAVDSFFDITYQIDLGGGLYHIDCFVDVSTEMTVDGEPNIGSAGEQTFNIEMVSMDLSSASSGPDAANAPALLGIPSAASAHGHVTVLKLPDGNFNVDSFFDVFTELSVDGGQSWALATDGPVRMEHHGSDLPEPSSLVLAVLGLLSLGIYARWRRR